MYLKQPVVQPVVLSYIKPFIFASRYKTSVYFNALAIASSVTFAIIL
jgi:hypothetical protein